MLPTLHCWLGRAGCPRWLPIMALVAAAVERTTGSKPASVKSSYLFRWAFALQSRGRNCSPAPDLSLRKLIFPRVLSSGVLLSFSKTPVAAGAESSYVCNSRSLRIYLSLSLYIYIYIYMAVAKSPRESVAGSRASRHAISHGYVIAYHIVIWVLCHSMV